MSHLSTLFVVINKKTRATYRRRGQTAVYVTVTELYMRDATVVSRQVVTCETGHWSGLLACIYTVHNASDDNSLHVATHTHTHAPIGAYNTSSD